MSGRLPGAGHRPAPAPVVEQGVDGLLQHALLVVDDDLGRAQVEQPLQPVVPVDHPAVEVVQVAGGEPATVELDHGPQLGRDDRDDVEDHGPGVVDPAPGLVPPVESGDDLEPLDGFLLALHGQVAAALVGLDHLAQLYFFLVEVDLLDQLGDGLGPHAAPEIIAEAFPQLAPQQLVLDDLAAVQVAELVEGPADQVRLGVGVVAYRGDLFFDLALASLQLRVLGPLALQLGQLLLELLVAPVDVQVALAHDVGQLLD